MKPDDIIEKNTDYLVTETTIKKNIPMQVVEAALKAKKSTAIVTKRMLQGGTASLVVIEKTKIVETKRDAVRKILGME